VLLSPLELSFHRQTFVKLSVFHKFIFALLTVFYFINKLPQVISSQESFFRGIFSDSLSHSAPFLEIFSIFILSNEVFNFDS
jgi:hypothetical protein